MLELDVKMSFDIDKEELNEFLPYSNPITEEEEKKLEEYFRENPVNQHSFIDWDELKVKMIEWYVDCKSLDEIRLELEGE